MLVTGKNSSSSRLSINFFRFFFTWEAFWRRREKREEGVCVLYCCCCCCFISVLVAPRVPAPCSACQRSRSSTLHTLSLFCCSQTKRKGFCSFGGKKERNRKILEKFPNISETNLKKREEERRREKKREEERRREREREREGGGATWRRVKERLNLRWLA